jgi:uncharacterized damage-inducible protein DinB
MNKLESNLTKPFLAQAQRVLSAIYLPRIARCLRQLSQKEIWWRPNPASNSVGNLVLHLNGNVRQWIVAGLGGVPDTRQRDLEFQERGPIPRRALLARLHRTVGEACRVLTRLSASDLAHTYSIQGFQVTGLEAVYSVTEHFSHHAGQIILVTKLLRGKSLDFTYLPGERKSHKSARSLPAV